MVATEFREYSLYEPVPKGVPSNTFICGLALMLMVNCLFHCLAYVILSYRGDFKEE